ncbi:MAG: trypsin-like peptidase domain-containing protein [Ignavibacteria bacterium]|nr:trypsin-like peptidase domain-containing protein [Ignavibacteria bacterium]
MKNTLKLLSICLIVFNLELYSQQFPSGYEIFEKAKNSVAIVNVYDENRNLLRLGAGFTYTPDGQIVTTYSLIEGGKYVKIKVNDKEYTPAALYKMDRRRDVVVYKINATNLPYLAVGNSDNMKVGDRIFTIGNPLGYIKSFSEGMISGKRDFGAGKIFFQFTGASSPGMIGSPVLNEKAEVIGLISARSYMSEEINFAIQVNSIKGILESEDVLNYGVPDFFTYEKPPTNFNIGLSYESMGDHATAIWYYLKSLKDDVNAETYRRLAYCHEQLGNLKFAEDYYKKAKELDQR